jgi:hypothetical protein
MKSFIILYLSIRRKVRFLRNFRNYIRKMLSRRNNKLIGAPDICAADSQNFLKDTKSPKLSSIRLELLPISELKSHEDIEAPRFKMLLSDIVSRKLVLKPIIVESKKFIVIDGHHRLAALKALGVKHVPAYVVDYHHDVPVLSGWMFAGEQVSGKVFKILEEMESLCKPGPDELLVKTADDMLHIQVDRIDIYLAIKEIDIINKLHLIKIPYNERTHSHFNVLILPPPLKHTDVYRIAEKGLVFPPRTTLHITDLKKCYRTFLLKNLL